MFGGIQDDQSGFNETWVFDAEAGEWSMLEDTDVSVPADNESGIPGFSLGAVFFALILVVFYRKKHQLSFL
jgi:hypothetical protein